MRAESYVYCWTNIQTGDRYIGKGRGKRASNHATFALAGRTYCPKFYAAIRKYGVESFELGRIAAGLTDATAMSVERAFIAMYGTQAEYNLTAGGEGSAGRVCRDETKAAIGRAHLGRKLPEEGRAKLSAAQNRPEVRAAKSRLHSGKCITAAHREVISRTHKGKPKSAEQRAKMSQSAALRRSPEREEAFQRAVHEFPGHHAHGFAKARHISIKLFIEALCATGWQRVARTTWTKGTR